jgi:8-oxo-dGTP diphosphatase
MNPTDIDNPQARGNLHTSPGVRLDPVKPVEVALALLYQEQRYLLQLRDDLPTIRYPGHWALFGGHLEPGETPEVALMRELVEEIGHQPSQLHFFRIYGDRQVTRYIYTAPLLVSLDQLTLGEGLDFGWIEPGAIALGQIFSHKIQQNRPLGKIHRQILLDFMAWRDSSAETRE